MAFPDEPQGAEAPSSETAPHRQDESAREVSGDVMPAVPDPGPDAWSSSGSAEAVTLTATVLTAAVPEPPRPAVPQTRAGSPPKPPNPPPPPPEEEDDEEGRMSRMSFLEHLEELRKRLILSFAGIGVAFVLCMLFSDQLWAFVFGPAKNALENLHVNPPTLKLISPMDAFQLLWFKVPILFSIFLSSPWVLYQVWAFISPGLYKKEKQYAVPFVVSSAGLFILGGLFAYYVAFRYGLEFLLGMGIGKGIEPGVNVNEYYDLFVDVMLGVGIVFEIPVLLFLLTLLHIASPAFLVRHSRYAILAIVFIAAVITPTGDAVNLALFATPMIILFYVGIFMSYLLVLRREKRRFPWGIFLKWTGIVLAVLLPIIFLVARYYGYHFVPRWPVFVK